MLLLPPTHQRCSKVLLISMKCQYINGITHYLLFEHILTFARFTKSFTMYQNNEVTSVGLMYISPRILSRLDDLTNQGLTGSLLIIFRSLLFPYYRLWISHFFSSFYISPSSDTASSHSNSQGSEFPPFLTPGMPLHSLKTLQHSCSLPSPLTC